MFLIYAETKEGYRFAYCRAAADALITARAFQRDGADLIEISDRSGKAVTPDEFERVL